MEKSRTEAAGTHGSKSGASGTGDRRTDVAIVGAGPAGLATAIGLAMRGIDFVILDALPEAQNTSRAAVIHAATLAELHRIGVADALVAQGIRVPDFRVRDRDDILLAASFATLRSPTPYALMIPQDESEALLVARLADLGHSVERPVRVTAVEATGEGARVRHDGPDGAGTIDCRFVVGADGEKSLVRQAAGIDFPGKTYGSFLLADVRMDWPIPREEVSLFFSDQGTLVIAPMSGERFRVVAQFEHAPSEPTIADVQGLLEARGPSRGARVRELLWGSRFQVHHKLADRFRDGATVLIGDAAHVHSPAGGQGMNLGLRDAIALPDALVAALRGGDTAALDGFAAARRRAASEVLAMTDRLTWLATMEGAGRRRLRNAILPVVTSLSPVRRFIAETLAGYR